MFFAVVVLLGVLIAWGVWRLLGKTNLSRAGRLLLALLIGAGLAVLLYWGTLYLSILAFQLRDRVGW